MVESISELKDEGNKHFKNNEINKAVSCYSRALESTADTDSSVKVTLYKNRSACYLKLQKYEKALKDADNALKIQPGDRKALYRRAQALENLGQLVDAYNLAVKLLHDDPKNTAFKKLCMHLRVLVDKKSEEQTSSASRFSQMTQVLFVDDPSSVDKEKRRTAANNLVLLCKEENHAPALLQEPMLARIMTLLTDGDSEVRLAAVRMLTNLAAQSAENSTQIISVVTLQYVLNLVGGDDPTLSTCACNLLKTFLQSLAYLNLFHERRDAYNHTKRTEGPQGLGPPPQLTLDEDSQRQVDEIMHALVKMIDNRKISACGRDSILELLVKMVPRKSGVFWWKKFVYDTDGITSSLTMASLTKETCADLLTQVSNATGQHISLLLSAVWDDLLSDAESKSFREQCERFFSELFGDENLDSKVEALTALSVLLQGPFDVGNGILGSEGVLQVMLAMAQSDNFNFQKTSVEALVHAVSKKEKCSGIVKQAVPILKKLYHSDSDYVKVRALVGLCKLGSAGGSDYSAKSFADGSTVTLGKACRKFLCNPAKDFDLRKWAAEGLTYLSLDADVKEDLVSDTKSVISLIELAKTSDRSVQYPIACVFVNCMNAYEKKTIDPEMIELAKFSKQHVPEDHPKDADEFVEKRVRTLSDCNIGSALVAISKTDSANTRELLARAFLAISTYEDLRGLLVQQGAGKATIPLALDNTDLGKRAAAQALAKIAISMNPEVAFPGQRTLEIVRPLVHLLHVENKAIENYESLLALTNLSSVGPTVRKRLYREGAIPEIEHYMYEKHEELRRGAVECMCNMIMDDDVLELYVGENDRVKLWVLYAREAGTEDEDPLLSRAVAGGLAMLSRDDRICVKVTEVNNWIDSLLRLTSHVRMDVQHPGIVLLCNMVECSKDIANQIVESQLLEVVMALAQLNDPQLEKIKKVANVILEVLAEYKLIEAAKK